MLPEITATIKQAGVEVATISQTTDYNLEDLDKALESFDLKFMSVMNKLIQDKGLTDDLDDEESDDSTTERPGHSGSLSVAEDSGSTGPSADIEASGDNTAVDSNDQEEKN